MTSTRRSCPFTLRLMSRSTLPGADDWPLSGVVRNRYAADDAAAPAAITPLMKFRRDGLLGISSGILMSSIAGPPRSGERSTQTGHGLQKNAVGRNARSR